MYTKPECSAVPLPAGSGGEPEASVENLHTGRTMSNKDTMVSVATHPSALGVFAVVHENYDVISPDTFKCCPIPDECRAVTWRLKAASSSSSSSAAGLGAPGGRLGMVLDPHLRPHAQGLAVLLSSG
ncbi:hypothetical protein EYF80_063955 [Liparis tanakae]|uniref:Uncharacterized protein n=1 Tax=Liparis tanakae TaxID=230148 RepID=A0A4Z2EAR9_9TELE|nr:hypothetical protein EYF80_063955 [Liparis tanakae]